MDADHAAGVPEYPPRRIQSPSSPQLQHHRSQHPHMQNPPRRPSQHVEAPLPRPPAPKQQNNPLRKSDSFSISSDPVFEAIEAANACIKSLSVDIDPSFESDYTEFKETLILAKNTVASFLSNALHDTVFDLCLQSVRNALDSCIQHISIIAETKGAVSIEKKIGLYRMDFLLKQRLDQFVALFRTQMQPTDIADIQGRSFWLKHFAQRRIVSWTTFLDKFEHDQEVAELSDSHLEALSQYLDFTRDGYVSIYEWNLFLIWFGPMHGAQQRLFDATTEGLICGFIPAVEANGLLENKRPGTYLIRFSKTQPSSFAVTFVDKSNRIKHCLLYHVPPVGMTLKNPPDVYRNLREFVGSHSAKLQFPVGCGWTSSPVMQKMEKSGKPLNLSSDRQTAELDEMGDKDDVNQCVVCMDRPIATVFLECGHLACCKQCAQPMKNCPICRAPITRVVQTFRP